MVSQPTQQTFKVCGIIDDGSYVIDKARGL